MSPDGREDKVKKLSVAKCAMMAYLILSWSGAGGQFFVAERLIESVSRDLL